MANDQLEEAKLEDFDITGEIGRGTFGPVYQCSLSSTGNRYALKAIKKSKILQ